MGVVFVDFSTFRKNVVNTLKLDEAAIAFLYRTKEKFINARGYHSHIEKSFWGKVTVNNQVVFSHNLVKSGPNQWHIIENKSKGEGGFGAVNESKFKIIIEKNNSDLTALVVPVTNVVKVQKPTIHHSQDEVLKMAEKEAVMQRKHGVSVYNVVDADDKVVTILEDCGTSLDKLFPLSKRYGFQYRLGFAARLASELLLLQQTDTVHRDLKPANICFKELPEGRFQLIFIDFGLAEASSSSANQSVAGTYLYMAPEIYSGQGSSSASDMYTFAAIFAQLFGANNIFKYKKLGKTGSQVVNALFCFDGLFEGYDISGVDPCLLEDIKALLTALGNKNPSSRPSVNELNKFISTIPVRQEVFGQYQEGLEQQASELARMRQLHQSIMGARSARNEYTSTMLRRKAEIDRLLENLDPPKSHYTLAKTLVRKNRVADLFGEDNPYPYLSPITSMISAENQKLENSLTEFRSFAECFREKCSNTNSSGVNEIIHILGSELPVIEKIQRLKAIGQSKTESGFFNWYSHSTIFGKGRHRNVDRLYHRLASIDPIHIDNASAYLAEAQLASITQFLSKNNFTHGVQQIDINHVSSPKPTE